MRLQPMDQLLPDQLYELLYQHALIPRGVSEEQLQTTFRVCAAMSAFALVVDDAPDGDAVVLAATLTMPLDAHSLAFSWIPEVKRLHTRKADLSALAGELRAFWFKDGIRRVEARTTTTRTQTIRTLKNIGFKQETLDGGLRQAVDYGKGPEGTVILGMLVSDPLRQFGDVTRQSDALGQVAPTLEEEKAHA